MTTLVEGGQANIHVVRPCPSALDTHNNIRAAQPSIPHSPLVETQSLPHRRSRPGLTRRSRGSADSAPCFSNPRAIAFCVLTCVASYALPALVAFMCVCTPRLHVFGWPLHCFPRQMQCFLYFSCDAPAPGAKGSKPEDRPCQRRGTRPSAIRMRQRIRYRPWTPATVPSYQGYIDR